MSLVTNTLKTACFDRAANTIAINIFYEICPIRARKGTPLGMHFMQTNQTVYVFHDQQDKDLFVGTMKKSLEVIA